jgi:uncharacterized membrane protein YvlD (DUF360 family)
MISAIWGTVVCGAILMAASSFMQGVRCNSFMDAVKVALIYGILCAIGGHLLALPIVLTTGIATVMTLGLGLPFALLFWGVIIGTPSLYIADQVIEGFEIDSVGTTAGVVVFLGFAQFLLSLMGLA